MIPITPLNRSDIKLKIGLINPVFKLYFPFLRFTFVFILLICVKMSLNLIELSIELFKSV